MSFSMPLFLTTMVSSATAIAVVLVTNYLNKHREHEADWRKLKLTQYQEFVLALSGVVSGRATSEAHLRYADAVNSLALVAPQNVLSALQDFQREISYLNNSRTDARHDEMLNILLRSMRKDIHDSGTLTDKNFHFHLLAPPPATVKV